MKTLNELLKQLPEWTFTNKALTLKAAENKVLEITLKSESLGNFEWNTKKYTIGNEGFWSPKLFIRDQAGTEILSFSYGAWGKKRKIIFANGTEYPVIIKNNSLITFVVTNTTGQSLFECRLDTLKCEVRSVFELKSTELPEQDALFLVICGVWLMKNIIAENSANDTMITIVAAAS